MNFFRKFFWNRKLRKHARLKQHFFNSARAGYLTDEDWTDSVFQESDDYSTNTSIHSTDYSDNEINPATGLPMSGGIDSAGNPYGVDNSDFNSDATNLTDSSFQDSGFEQDDFGSSGTGFDDDFWKD